MKINFQFKNNFQIVDAEDLNESFDQLKEKCQELTNQNPDNLSISFLDIEEEEIKINDKHDYEYMISNLNPEKTLTLKIEKNSDEKNSGFFAKKNFVENEANFEEKKNLGNLKEKKIEDFEKIDFGKNEKIEEEEKKNDLENEGDLQKDCYHKSETFMILRKKSEECKEKIDKSVQIEKYTCEVSIGREENNDKCSGFEEIKNSGIIEKSENFKKIENNANLEIIDQDENLKIEKNEKSKKLEEILDFENIDVTEEKIEDKPDFDEEKIDFKDISMIQAPENEDLKEEKKKLRQKKKTEKKKKILDDVLKKNTKLQNLEAKIDLLENLLLNTEKFFEKQTKTKKNQKSQFSHKNIICNNCKKKDFSGKRYKCVICKNLDLCQNCEDLNIHKHPMIVIKKKVDNLKLEKFVNLNEIRENFIYKDLDLLKTTILVNLTDKQYPKHFYDSMIDNYKKFKLGDFILEIIKIFA